MNKILQFNKRYVFYWQVDENDNVDYDMMVSLIPEQYFDRVTKMIFGCKHLG